MGVKVFENTQYEDERGSFRKILENYDGEGFSEPLSIKELFATETKRGGLRGMHLQINDSQNARLVTVLKGEILDCLLDLRPKSETFRCVQSVKLNEKNRKGILIPSGVAHGFQALESALVLYAACSRWDKSIDGGVNPLSFGFAWPMEVSHISTRDAALPNLGDWC